MSASGRPPRIVALCGGVGGAKLAYGLAQVLPPEALTIVVNTGDDFEHLGLLICPDLDTVTYTLGEVDHPVQGWGRAEESHQVMREVARLGGPDWFSLGDKDIALHLLRRRLLDEGHDLTAVTRRLTAHFGINHQVRPATNDRLRTIVNTDEGVLAFQDYFVRRRCAPRLIGLDFEGRDRARPTAEVLSALDDPALTGIIFCPSNPFVSIGPILALDDIRNRLMHRNAPVLAVSPIIGGRALKGPAAKMMAELGGEVSSLAVARHYGSLIDRLLLDEEDRGLLDVARDSVPALSVAGTIMRSRADRIALARHCLTLLSDMAR